jgi:hypothetical protein
MQALLPSITFLKKTITPNCLSFRTLLLLISFLGIQGVKGQTNPTTFDMSTGNSYSFSSWPSTSIAGTYPSNMYIWQHNTSDPTLITTFNANYSIAYNFTSKSRCSGQGNNGISFVNTSSNNTGGGNLGGAVLGINTSGRNSILVQWTGRTFGSLTFASGSQDRATSIRLQYKVGNTGTWTDVSSSVEYSSLSSSNTYYASGSSSNFSQSLPTACDGQTIVYLRWIYYTVSGSNGSRPELGIDDILVTSSLASTPTITGAATATAFTSTYGTASSPQSFSISGSNLSANLIATAPTGFEVSSDGTTYGTTANFTQSGGSVSGTLRIRLAATAAVSGSYNSQNIVLSSTGATNVNITTASSGNVVNAAALSVTASAQNRNYNTTSPTSGTLNTNFTISGLKNSDAVSGCTLAYNNSGNLATANAGTYTITPSAVVFSSGSSSNYSITYNTGTLTVNALQLTAPSISSITGGNSSLSVVFSAPSNANATGSAITNYKYSTDGGTTFTACSPAQTTSPLSITALTNNTTYNVQILAVNSYGDGLASTTVQGTPVPVPTINAAISFAAFTTTYGTSSSAQSLAVTGTNLTNDITATAPTGFEVSSDGTTYGATATFTQSGGSASGTLYIRLSATATVGSYNSQNIVLTSTGATNVILTTTASGNSVNAAAITITGLTAGNKTYDGGTSVSVTGSASYAGLKNGETFSIVGNPSWAFASKTVGTAKTITQTGSYSAPSSNYSITQPILTADITAATLTITNPAVTSKTYDGSTIAAITGTLNGVISPDVVSLNLSGIFSTSNAGTGISVTSSSTLSGTDAGNYTLTQPTGLTGDITKANQTITFAALTNKSTADAPFTLNATSSSGLSIVYSSSNTSVATISGNTITIIGAGTTTITASQNGDNNFNAATSILQTLTVIQALAGWDFFGISSPATCAATYFNSNLISTSNSITRGSGASASSGGNSFRTTGFQNNGIATTNTDYFQITLQAASGYKLSLSSIDAQFIGTNTFYASPGVTSQFAYSLDGTNFTLIGSPQISTSLTLSQINLSSITALQNVANPTVVYLRYYASGQTSTGGWGFSSPSAGSYGLLIGGTISCTTPAAPTATSPQILCPSATVNSLAATGTNIQWYDAASGGNLLSSATALTHISHYYATQTVNGCESSTRTDVIASLQNVWSGSSSSNWNNASNWTCGHVPTATENVLINSGSPVLDINYEVPTSYTLTLSGGTLTINPGNKLTITGTTNFGNQLVTVAANASNTGAIVLNGGSSIQNATNVALQQWFTGQRAWRMLSNPFTTSITGSSIANNNTGFSVNQSGTGDIVVYNSTNDSWSANTTIAANSCYAFFYKGLQSDFNGTPGLSNYSGAGPTASVYSVKGTLNTGSVTVTPSNASPAYTLVGNPFAAPVNSIALTGGAAAPYFYYQANAASTDIKVKSGAWIANSGSSNNTTIPMMGLIAYQASSTTSFTIPITDINTSGSAISALFKTTAAATQMNIDLMKNNILFDRCILREDADATAQRLDQKDLLKMENVTANIYTLTPANDHLAVYTEPSFTQAIPLAISAPVGTFQFNIQNAMNSTADWYLIDNYLHQQKLLTNNSTYSFDINNDAASKGSQRFELSKQTWTTSIGTTSNQESIQLLGNLVQDHITLQVDATIHQANYQLVDLRGAVLAQGTLSAGKQEIAMASLASGLYILHIQNDNQRLAYKITKQ